MKVYVGSAVYRTIEALQLRSLIPLLVRPDVQYNPIIGDALIERSRSISATNFLRNTDADVHLSIDSDIVDFDTDKTLEMCEQTMEHDIVGALYVTRSMERTFPTSFPFQGQEMLLENDPTPVPMQYLATGFMAVHRRVFEKLAEDMPLCHEKDNTRAFYPFYLPFVTDDDEGNPFLLSEDWAFSKRARDAGFGLNLNPSIRLGHASSMVYRIEDMFQEPIAQHALTLERKDGTHWRLESAKRNGAKAQEPVTMLNRQQRRLQERAKVKSQ